MSTVTQEENQVKTLPRDVEEVLEWHTHKAGRGELPTNTARLRCTALRQILTVLDEQDPTDLAWIAANLEPLAKRFALKTRMSADTVATYTSRARTALADYMRWRETPNTFAFRVRAVSPGDKPARKPAPALVPEAPSSTADTVPSPVAEPAMQFEGAIYVGRLPLSDGRTFSFTLPKGGITRRDLRRISHHLMTLCEDFDAEQDAALVVRDRD